MKVTIYSISKTEIELPEEDAQEIRASIGQQTDIVDRILENYDDETPDSFAVFRTGGVGYLESLGGSHLNTAKTVAEELLRELKGAAEDEA